MTRACIIIALIALITACSGQSGKLRIEGQMKGVNEDNYLILSTDGGLSTIDTLHIKEGEFTYTCELDDKATYHIIFPNMTDVVVWGHSGDVVRLEGSSEELKNVSIKGNKENDLYTKFRHKINSLSTQDSIRDEARTFITDNTTSPVAVEVYRQHFLHNAQATKDDQQALLKQLIDAQPDNQQLVSFRNTMHKRAILEKGKPLPKFDLTDMDSTRHRLSDYRGRYLLILFWAAWQSASDPAFYHIQQMEDEGRAAELDILTINLDIEPTMVKDLTQDIHWPTIAPMKGWDTPYVNQLGIRTLPYAILVDRKGKVLAAGANYNKDVKPAVENILK